MTRRSIAARGGVPKSHVVAGMDANLVSRQGGGEGHCDLEERGKTSVACKREKQSTAR